MKRLKAFCSKMYLTLIFVFLYAPIVTLIVFSFNEGKGSRWNGFSMHWYEELFKSEIIMEALGNTLLIAVISALAATVIGTITCIGISALKGTPKSVYMALNNIPLLNSDLVTGLSLMLIFITIGLERGYSTILVAHITFNIPYVILSVMPKLRQCSKYTYEAAIDLGATPVRAFMKVVFPELVPGIASGFMLAFTMSLDDFIITHFTKGGGINTLSTLIYSEVRKGIKPTMNALSTIMFVSVLILLVVTNILPKRREQIKKLEVEEEKKPKKKLVWVLGAAAAIVIVCVSGWMMSQNPFPNGEVRVFNWGEYIDEELITEFEERYGIEVVYDTYDTNEAMYPKVMADPSMYDVVCPSEYMIEKMMENNLLQEINWDLIPHAENIGEMYMESCTSFDPDNKYCVPYTFGTVGILYNTTMIEEGDVIDSWDVLWDESYANNMIMQDSVRDAFMISLKRLGYSLNSTDVEELEAAKKELQIQSKLNKAYAVDEVRDKMINGAAALGVIYSGEYLYCKDENPDLAYVVPKEGSNIWYDAWVITSKARNVENAHKWLDFLCEADVALKNFEYIYYGTPNVAAQEMIDEEILNDKGAFPDAELIDRCEVYLYLGAEAEDLYYELWKEVK